MKRESANGHVSLCFYSNWIYG